MYHGQRLNACESLNGSASLPLTLHSLQVVRLPTCAHRVSLLVLGFKMG